MRESVSEILLKLFFRSFYVVKDSRFGNFVCLRMLLRQKIFRTNSAVNWPCHFTSSVKMPGKVRHQGSCPGYNPGCYIDGRNGIEIGNSVWIGPHVSLISMNHKYPNYEEYVVEDPIKIGDRVWIGAGATILPGVQIGNGVVVAAGAIVTKSSGAEEDKVVLAGNPAKILKRIS